MRSWWGVASLLVALAIVGVVATRQLRSVGAIGAGVRAAGEAGSTPPGTGAEVAARSQDIQRQVQADVARALAQGAASRAGEADAP